MAVMLKLKQTGADDVRLALRRFSLDETRKPRDFLNHLADWVADQQKDLFETEGASNPPAWPALSPRYALWKRAHYPGTKILERTGDLKKAVTERPFGTEVITDSQFTFGTSLPYALFHQLGVAGRLPKRHVLIRFDKQVVTGVRVELQKWIMEGRA